MPESIIVSRHAAGVEFVGREMHPSWHPPVLIDGWLTWLPVGLEPEDPAFGVPYDRVRVVRDATPDDVRGRVVYGNLPLPLACLAVAVVCIEFSGTHPRGAEYTLADMDAAGAQLARYVVRSEKEYTHLANIAGVTF